MNLFGRKKPRDDNQKNSDEGFYKRLKSRLNKTRRNFSDRIHNLLSRWTSIDEELFDELEEILIQADVGMQTTMEIVENLKEDVKEKNISEPSKLEELLKDSLLEILTSEELKLISNPEGLNIIMMVGVNGVGKTTTIAKLAQRFKQNGERVLLAAADTFRAGAIEQISTWGNRLGIDVIKHEEGSDPGAVVYDALQASKARGVDQLIIDTAGRLHTQKNLMQELNKIKRIIDQKKEDATVEVLLVMDATVGQNGINQARFFHEAVQVTGVVLTKLDGTARGGVVVAVTNEFQLPVKLIGIGEQPEDLREFNPSDFVEALFDRS